MLRDRESFPGESSPGESFPVCFESAERHMGGKEWVILGHVTM